jgi:hypothetical protein
LSVRQVSGAETSIVIPVPEANLVVPDDDVVFVRVAHPKVADTTFRMPKQYIRVNCMELRLILPWQCFRSTRIGRTTTWTPRTNSGSHPGLGLSSSQAAFSPCRLALSPEKFELMMDRIEKARQHGTVRVRLVAAHCSLLSAILGSCSRPTTRSSTPSTRITVLSCDGWARSRSRRTSSRGARRTLRRPTTLTWRSAAAQSACRPARWLNTHLLMSEPQERRDRLCEHGEAAAGF